MEWSTQQVARLSGVTSRTLRHYDAVGLLTPSRVGPGGIRYDDERAVVRLQRVLLLRGLGLRLAEIGRLLDREVDEVAALAARHLAWLAGAGHPGCGGRRGAEFVRDALLAHLDRMR